MLYVITGLCLSASVNGISSFCSSLSDLMSMDLCAICLLNLVTSVRNSLYMVHWVCGSLHFAVALAAKERKKRMLKRVL